MLLLSSIILGLFHQSLAQSTIGDPFTAATTDQGAPTGICGNENGLLSCIPQATVCPGTIPAVVSSCGCTNIQTVINCYSTFCPAQLTEDEIMALSSMSNVLCHGIGTITLPTLPTSSGAAATMPVATSSGTVKVTATTSGKGAGATGTSSGGSTSSTSKAAAEAGMGGAVPALGGVLGTLVGIIGLFL